MKKGAVCMKRDVVDYCDEKITIRCNDPKKVGSDMDIEVRLPEGILVQSLLLKGTVVRCAREERTEPERYVLELKIDDLTPLNEKILDAYKDFLDRERKIQAIKIDIEGFQRAFENFGRKLRLLRRTAEEVRKRIFGCNRYDNTCKACGSQQRCQVYFPD